MSCIRNFFKKSGIFLWRGLTPISLAGFIIMWVQLCSSRDELKLLKNRYDESKSAELAIDYRSVNMYDPPKLTISNIGDKKAESVWISEKIFLYADDSSIYECDLPRFDYVLFNGSSKRMFDIEANTDTVIDFSPKCFGYYRKLILNKYPGRLIVQWNVDFDQENNSIRVKKSEYFVLTRRDLPTNYLKTTGGYGMVEKIIQYEKFGPIRKLSSVFGKLVFLNHPNRFYIDSSQVAQTLLPEFGPDFKKPQTEIINIEDGAISHSGEGYHAFIWKCEATDFKGKYLISDTSSIY